MANVINYTDLFDRLRVLIKYFNILEVRQVNVAATDYPLHYIKNQILSPYESQDITNELLTLETDFDIAISSIETLKRAIIVWFEAALAGSANNLGVWAASTPRAVLDALTDAMLRDSETLNARELIVHASDVVDTTIKPHTSNIGVGKLIYTFIRPGRSPSEIANTEVLQCQCISSATPSEEVFRLSGEEKHNRESHRGQGSGPGPTIIALGKSIANGNFEDWTADAADNWTAVLGAWGTEIVQDADEYEGTYCIKTAYAQGDWKITHAVPITLLPDTIYVIALWAKKGAGATGTLRLGISNGNAVDDFVANCVKSIDIAGLSTSYTFQFFVFKTPLAVDSTWTLGISSDSPAVADILFDLCQFGTMTAFNNMHFAICSGVTGFGLTDKFGFGSDNVGFEIAESAAGIIQKFIGRCFDTQLPSATGAGETINDPT